MVKIARGNYPDSTFVQTDFLKFSLSPSSSQASSGEDLLAAEIDSVVFKEVLHNFLDIKEALSHAKSLLLLSGVHTHRTSTPAPKEKSIVISNPKGYAGISKQHAMNRWLCPSPLPSEQELVAASAAGIALSRRFNSAAVNLNTLTVNCERIFVFRLSI